VILERVRATSYSAVGRELGVSGEAVKKHLKTRGAL
jgi:predicted ArsR family transcriptional regulator